MGVICEICDRVHENPFYSDADMVPSECFRAQEREIIRLKEEVELQKKLCNDYVQEANGCRIENRRLRDVVAIENDQLRSEVEQLKERRDG